LLEDVEALLNPPQSHFDGVSFLKEIVRLRKPKQKAALYFYLLSITKVFYVQS
jgi:hypothetical protein